MLNKRGAAAMHVNSTEIQNNFGKYLMMSLQEDIIITKNGREVAKLSAIHDKTSVEDAASAVNEGAADYIYSGRKATYEEYLKLVENSEERYEYIDGEIYFLASPKTTHQIVLKELFVIFYNWFQGKKCTPMIAPYDITLKRGENDINIVQPDLMVICDLEKNLNEDDYYTGIPTLVVEIISEYTRRKDFVKKLDLYMTCGIQEYWIVNPYNKEVTIFLFRDKDIYKNITFRGHETAKSFVFQGLTADLKKVFG